MKQLEKRDLHQVAGAGRSPYVLETIWSEDGSITFKFEGWKFTVSQQGTVFIFG